MRKSAISTAAGEEENNIDLTPMLDVVFIMLIFFIVTANFIKEPGVTVERPEADTAVVEENAGILIAITPTGEIWMDGRRVDERQIKANIVRMRADRPEAAVVIRAGKKSTADKVVLVIDGARAAGVDDISLATEEE